MKPEFRFRIEPIAGRYQVQIGLEFERGCEFIPAHRSAFARHLALVNLHDRADDAQREMARLQEWLAGRQTPRDAQMPDGVELAG